MKIVARVAALAVALLFALLQVPAANAAQFYGTQGRVGAVTLTGPMITGYDYRTQLANGYELTTKAWEAGGLTIGRSPSYAYAQDVGVRYVLQRHVGGRWVTWADREYSARVWGTGRASFPTWAYTHPTLQDARYAYRVLYFIAWYPAGSTQNVANTLVIPSAVADNRCQIRFGTPCQAHWDGIVF